MGNIIVVVLILVWVYTTYAKKQKHKDAPNPGSQYPPVNGGNNQGRPANPGYGGNNQGRPANPGYGGNNRGRPANPGYGQRASGSQAAQQQLKSRLQQKYAGRPLSAYAQQRTRQSGASAGDILERAINNVKENEQDELRGGMEAESRNTAGVLTNLPEGPVKEGESKIPYLEGLEFGLVSGESELIRQINDLMVMGFSGSLTFERDFIAEGVDMLNRFEIQKE